MGCSCSVSLINTSFWNESGSDCLTFLAVHLNEWISSCLRRCCEKPLMGKDPHVFMYNSWMTCYNYNGTQALYTSTTTVPLGDGGHFGLHGPAFQPRSLVSLKICCTSTSALMCCTRCIVWIWQLGVYVCVCVLLMLGF
jgi:hypothetical protein